MIKTWLQRAFRPKPHERGQSIIILAFAFLMLLAFVGITTDVSLLYVRYNSLARAVDSAAVAAAGQMRADRRFASVVFAAQQFLQANGQAPSQVIVEICMTNPGDTQLCDAPNFQATDRKLVRVIAQSQFQTVFLRLLGYPVIALEAVAVSETAQLDVVLVMDVSESMLDSTIVDQVVWNAARSAARLQGWTIPNVPQPYVPNPNPAIDSTIDYSYSDIGMGFLYTVPSLFRISAIRNQPNVFYKDVFREYVSLINTDPNHQATIMARPEVTSLIAPISGVPGGVLQPRPQCRVWFYPYSSFIRQLDFAYNATPVLRPTWRGMYDFMLDRASWTTWLPDNGASTPTGNNMGNPNSNTNYRLYWDGFVPTYNFFGCCNDPGNGSLDPNLNGNIINPTDASQDWDFSDLICQPFKEARDATRLFLNNIDFARGDRVAYVTFDRRAYVIDPDGAGTAFNPMLERREVAVRMLNKVIGIRAENSYYIYSGTASRPGDAPIANLGGWINFTSNETGADNPPALNFASDRFNYPVWGNCAFQNAGYRNDRNFTAFFNFGTPTTPTDTVLARIMIPTRAEWLSVPRTALNGERDPGISYEMRGFCREGNISSALREANNTLNNPLFRRESSVWVVILISDGGVGGTDPAIRGGVSLAGQGANPYTLNNPTPNDVVNGWGTPGTYGAYGICPWRHTVDKNRAPYCSDENPTTRQFCSPRLGNRTVSAQVIVTVDLNECNQNGANPYDAEDYTRDWADWIALETRVDPVTGDLVNDTITIRPTFFTIGFGLNFDFGSGSCADNMEDCLGQELLRYIADAGDNAQLDTDYQQDYYDDGVKNNSLTAAEYGPPGPCEDTGSTPSVPIMLPEGESCGNYYAAPNAQELQQVFDDIAGRMFTRISS
jgi:hypothetical protein